MMIDYKIHEHVKIKPSGATGHIMSISFKGDIKYYCIQYDEEFEYLDPDMCITYVKAEDIEKLIK